MSALFGRKDYKKTLEAYVKKGSFGAALKFAIESGDRLYDAGNIDEAISLYSKLLELFDSHSVSDHSLYEKLLEKIIPLFFESDNESEGIAHTIRLVEEKIALNKIKEAKEILDALIANYKVDDSVIIKRVEISLREGNTEEALAILEDNIEGRGAHPRLIELTAGILMNLERYDEAYDYFSALLAIEPENEVAKSGIRKIEALRNETEKETASEENTDKESGTRGGVLSPRSKIENNEQERKTLSVKKKVLKTEPVKEEKTKAETSDTKKETQQAGAKKSETLNIFKNPAYSDAVNLLLLKKDEGIKKFLSLAKEYENSDPMSAEYVYHKLLLVEPDRKDIYDKLINMYEKSGRKSDLLIILRAASYNCSGADKLSILKKLENISVGNSENIRKEIFDTAIELKDTETAVEYFMKLKDNKTLFSELAKKLYPFVSGDLRLLNVISNEIYKNTERDEIAFKYFYAFGSAYFNMGSKPEGLKWLMRAHSINSLPLEDCIKVAQYVKELPLDSERDQIAKALSGYVKTVTDKDKKESIYKLLLELKPANSVYIKEYADFLDEEKRFKDEASLLKKLIDKMDINAAEFIFGKIFNVSEYFTDEELFKAAELFEAGGHADKVGKIYEILLKRNPDNPLVLMKLLYSHLEMEDQEFVVEFFKKHNPSHHLAEHVEPIILNLEKKRSSAPLDYHVHFVLGFMYFFVERFEESIAAFQFVARSHHFESLMHLFIGISFEKISLPDFAYKQYETVVNSVDAIPSLKEDAYMRMALLKRKNGDMQEAMALLNKVLAINPDNEVAKKLLKVLPEEKDKITKFEGE